MNYRPNYRVSTLVFSLLTLCFAFAYYNKKAPVIERIVYLATNQVPPTIVVTNNVIYTNVVQVTPTPVTITNASPISLSAPEPLDARFKDEVGLRPVIRTNVIEATGMTEFTFSLTWNPDDLKSLRIALVPTIHLEDKTADTLELSASRENLARIVRRFTVEPDGCTNKIPTYYVARKCAKALTEAPKMAAAKAEPSVSPDRQPSNVVTNVPVKPEIVPAPVPMPPPHPTSHIRAEAVNAQKPEAVSSKPVGLPHRTDIATVRLQSGRWVNPAQLPPPISVNKVTFSTALTDYTYQSGTWLGIYQDRRGTKLYYLDRDAPPSVTLVGRKTLRVSVPDRFGRTQQMTIPLAKKVDTRKFRVVAADPDSFGIGVAFLREETKNGRIDPPMTLALHPELRSPANVAQKEPPTKTKRLLSPKAASLETTPMRKG